MKRARAMRFAILLGAAVVLTACAGRGVDVLPTVEDPWLRSTPNGIGAAYFTITMPGDDRLIAADTDPAIADRIEVHEVIEDEGRMLMRETDGGIPLPAGEPVTLRPGGFHLMLLDMPEMLQVGSRVTLTLRFAEADPITVTAEVREGAGSEPASDSGVMEHGTMPHGDLQHGQHGQHDQHDQHGQHDQHSQHGSGHGSMQP